MEIWETYYNRAVRDSRIRDSKESRKGYERAWKSTGRQLGLKKEPKPCPTSDTDWLYD